MKLTRSFTCGGVLALCLAALILAAGCASIEVAPKSQPVVSLTKPKQVLVYDFAVSPDEVRLQNGIDLRLKELVNQPSRTEQELAIGRQMAEALLKHLLVEVQSLGIPAVHATTNSIVNSETLLVKGQFISIAEGNQAGRMVIGLEMGSTEVRTLTQVYGVVQGEKKLLDEFDINARSRRKPGVAKTLGAGAATGHLAASAVVSSGPAVGSETFLSTVDADASRAARVIAGQLRDFYLAQGWIRK